jgi:uncharacterized protein YndB with AHSA1/START domain
MNGKHQLRRSRSISVPPGEVWAILEDSMLLPRWATVVDDVQCRVPGPETVGSIRECRVNFAGREGSIVERCVAVVPGTTIAYVVDEDTLGFNRMFADYGFTITLATAGRGTSVRMDTYYTPRNVLTWAMNALVMRRKFAKTVDALLEGLATLAEERASAGSHRRTASAGPL